MILDASYLAFISSLKILLNLVNHPTLGNLLRIKTIVITNFTQTGKHAA